MKWKVSDILTRASISYKAREKKRGSKGWKMRVFSNLSELHATNSLVALKRVEVSK